MRAQVDRYVAVLFPANSKRQDPKDKCTIKLDVSDGSVIRSDIKHSDDTYCGTKISEVCSLLIADSNAMVFCTKIQCRRGTTDRGEGKARPR